MRLIGKGLALVLAAVVFFTLVGLVLTWAPDKPVGELKARLDIEELPQEDRGRYNTLAGLLMAVSGELPAVGERIECARWQFEVTGLEGKRIDKVLARTAV